jgi:hypothetical protein
MGGSNNVLGRGGRLFQARRILLKASLDRT